MGETSGRVHAWRREAGYTLGWAQDDSFSGQEKPGVCPSNLAPSQIPTVGFLPEC